MLYIATYIELPYIQYWDVNNSYGWAMLQKLPVNNFESIKDTSQFNEDFIKTIIKKVIEDSFLKLIFSILKNYMNFIMIFHFWLKKIKIEKVKKLVANLHYKNDYVIHIRNIKQVLNHGLVFKKC